MKKIILIIGGVAFLIFVIGFAYYTISKNKFEKQTKQNLIKAKQTYDAIPVWHKKLHTKQNIKIGLINDTHVHPIRINRADKSKNAKRVLKSKDVTPILHFVDEMKVFEPQFVVHIGDIIEGTGDSDNVGIMGLELVKEELEKINVPIHWVVGNHDLRSVTKEQFKKTLNLDSLVDMFDVGDYRFIMLDANYNRKNLSRTPNENVYIRGKIPPQEIEWLKKQLQTDKRVFIFIHQGIFLDRTPGDLKDNGRPKMKQSIDNAKELQNILKEYRVDGVFNGHMEARKYNKINRWTNVYSLTGTKKSELYPDSFYEFTITQGVPDVTMYYIPSGTIEIKKVDFESGEK